MTPDRWDVSLKMTLLPLSIHSSLRQTPVPAWKPPVAARHSMPRPQPTRGATPPSAGARALAAAGCRVRRPRRYCAPEPACPPSPAPRRWPPPARTSPRVRRRRPRRRVGFRVLLPGVVLLEQTQPLGPRAARHRRAPAESNSARFGNGVRLLRVSR